MPKKIEDGGFVLVLPPEIRKQIPMLARGLADDLVEFLNKLDWNHDNKRDIAQYFPFVIKALPWLIEFGKQIDWEKVLAFVIATFVKDKLIAMKSADKLMAIHAEATETKIA